MMPSVKNQVGLFFLVDDELLFHGCSVADGEIYGDFVNYPHSHYDIWDQGYQRKYGVDFDYFPRGRVVYRQTDKQFLLYYDRCIEGYIQGLVNKLELADYILDLDEHYQCHNCNRDYNF